MMSRAGPASPAPLVGRTRRRTATAARSGQYAALLGYLDFLARPCRAPRPARTRRRRWPSLGSSSARTNMVRLAVADRLAGVRPPVAPLSLARLSHRYGPRGHPACRARPVRMRLSRVEEQDCPPASRSTSAARSANGRAASTTSRGRELGARPLSEVRRSQGDAGREEPSAASRPLLHRDCMNVKGVESLRVNYVTSLPCSVNYWAFVGLLLMSHDRTALELTPSIRQGFEPARRRSSGLVGPLRNAFPPHHERGEPSQWITSVPAKSGSSRR